MPQPSRKEKEKQILSLISELRFAYAQLAVTTKQVGLNINAMAGATGVLADLYNEGEKTMPQLMTVRVYSRQYLHRLIKVLEDEGLVTSRANPKHKSSKIYFLTDEGIQHIEEKKSLLMETFLPISKNLTKKDIESGLKVLTTLRQGFKAMLD